MASNSESNDLVKENSLPTTTTTTLVIEESELNELQNIGHGSFGNVFSAVWNGKKVAVKVFAYNINNDEKALRKYNEEVDKTAKLEHQNVVDFFGKTQIDGKNAFVMELAYCSLKTIIHNKRQTYSFGHALKWLTDIVEAVIYMHGKKIIHRDLKPENILMFIQNDGSLLPKLADFGISREKHTTNSTMTADVGTPAYIAPEVIQDKYDHRCDVWSFGVIAWELYYRQKPFAELTNGMAIMFAVCSGQRPYNNYLRYHCPDEIQVLIERSLKQDYKNRIEMADILISLKASRSASKTEIISMDRAIKMKTTGSSIDKWLLLNRLPADLKSRVRLASVFRSAVRYEAVFITDDDEAYWVMAKLNEWRVKNDCEPEKIDVLSGKKVKSLTFSRSSINDQINLVPPCVLALTKNGQVLVWSKVKKDGFIQMFVKNDGVYNETGIVSGLIGKTIIQLAVGVKFALALTDDGEVWSWGHNYCGQLGIGTTCDVIQPEKVTEEIGSRRTVAIACGEESSFAVMDNGEVYSWGWIGPKRLHSDRLLRYWEQFKGWTGWLYQEHFKTIPTKIESLAGVRRLTSGPDYAFAITNDGSMYAWGENGQGQLGTGDKKYRSKPVKIGSPGVEFIDVATIGYSMYSDIICFSAALSYDDVRMWGWCRDENSTREGQFSNVRLPKEIESESLHDAIADFSELPMTWKTMVIRKDNSKN